MAQHAGEIAPCIHLLALKFQVDVLEGQEANGTALQVDADALHRELAARFGLVEDFAFGSQVLHELDEHLVPFGQVMEVVEAIDAQQLKSGVVRHQHIHLRIESQ